MNFFTILSQLILLSVSYTTIRGQDVLICHLNEVSIPPTPTYADVKLWKNTRQGYYYFTKTQRHGYQMVDALIYQNFLIENVYSMVGRLVWFITNFEPSVIVKFETTEQAQQFYLGLNPYLPAHPNRFRANEVRIIPPAPNNPTIIANEIAIDIYMVNDPRGQDSSTRRIIVHKTQFDQEPYCIFFSNEYDLELGPSNTNTLIFWVTPEIRHGQWSCSVEIDFPDLRSRRKFVTLHRRFPAPVALAPPQYIRYMRSLRPTDTCNATPASSSDESEAP